MDVESLDNPAFGRRPVTVFLPRGADGPRPVVFFSHGYGPNFWQAYEDFVTHIVSLGNVVVYSTYPALGDSMDGRYEALWQGFAAAVKTYAGRMDLGRVGFVGHSFGGGATPAMAYRGLVQQGWGRQGAFLMELAPWYAYQVTTAQLHDLPANAVQLLEVYDHDVLNDHRMAIDLHDSSRLAAQFFLMVHSIDRDGCRLTADHTTPARNASLRLKQYAVFRPFDALADYVFNGAAAGRSSLEALGAGTGFQPVTLEAKPQPAQPESAFKFPWHSRLNPRLAAGN
jgi:hypothetical protein